MALWHPASPECDFYLDLSVCIEYDRYEVFDERNALLYAL